MLIRKGMDILLQLISIVLLSSRVSGQIGHRYGHFFNKNLTISPKHQQEHESSLEFAADSMEKINNNCVDFHTNIIRCFRNGKYLRVGFCATFDHNSEITSVALCPYLKPNYSNVMSYNRYTHYIPLPENISKLNDYMCGPMNRKGRVCSECMDGYGPAVMSVGFDIQCSNCTGTWYGVPLFLFLEFFPTTVFYFISLLFQLNITSGAITCFILYSQVVVIAYDRITAGDIYDVTDIMFTADANSKLIDKILLTVYDVWNLRFFRYLIPPFCVSSRLKSIHLAYLSYISVIYPLCLIVATWLCVELYDRNFKPLVYFFRPLVRCLVRVRRSWNTRSDLINVFASFFLLSFSKVLFQFIFLLTYQKIFLVSDSNFLGESLMVQYDLSVPYGSNEHIAFAVPSVLFCFILIVLPTLLLILYPFRIFRAILSKCKLDGIALNTFVEKFYGCYRNGLDGGKDMRSFAGLYFVVRIMLLIPNVIGSWLHISQDDPYYLRNVIFTFTAVLVALCRPYKVAYMNIMDTLLLVHLGLTCHLVSSYAGFEHQANFVITLEAMFALPIIGFVLFILARIVLMTGILRMMLQKLKELHCTLAIRDVCARVCPCCEERPPMAEMSAEYGSIDIQHF